MKTNARVQRETLGQSIWPDLMAVSELNPPFDQRMERLTLQGKKQNPVCIT